MLDTMFKHKDVCQSYKRGCHGRRVSSTLRGNLRQRQRSSRQDGGSPFQKWDQRVGPLTEASHSSAALRKSTQRYWKEGSGFYQSSADDGPNGIIPLWHPTLIALVHSPGEATGMRSRTSKPEATVLSRKPGDYSLWVGMSPHPKVENRSISGSRFQVRGQRNVRSLINRQIRFTKDLQEYNAGIWNHLCLMFRENEEEK